MSEMATLLDRWRCQSALKFPHPCAQPLLNLLSLHQERFLGNLLKRIQPIRRRSPQTTRIRDAACFVIVVAKAFPKDRYSATTAPPSGVIDLLLWECARRDGI